MSARELRAGVGAMLWLIVGLAASLSAAAVPGGWTATAYDPGIPTLEQVVGHPLGAQITGSAEALRYLQALAEAAPDRLRLIEYARSWEGRPLVNLLVGSPDRLRCALGWRRVAYSSP
ncbi:MAG: hypothetical protein AAGA68_23380 [Pseudomonadota bacterium]